MEESKKKQLSIGLLECDYVHVDLYKTPEALVRIREQIDKALKDRPGYGGVSFSDVFAYGIQVHVSHKRAHQMQSFQPTLRYQVVGRKGETTPDVVRGCQPTYDAEGVVKAAIDWWNTEGEEISRKNPCDHEFVVVETSRCYVGTKCKHCGMTSCIDSSD